MKKDRDSSGMRGGVFEVSQLAALAPWRATAAWRKAGNKLQDAAALARRCRSAGRMMSWHAAMLRGPCACV